MRTFQNAWRLAWVAAAAASLAACGNMGSSSGSASPAMGSTASAATMAFGATLSGAAEVPPNTSSGSGTMTATLDKATNVFTYRVVYTGLSGPATMAHIHGPAMPGANAGVVLPFQGATSPIEGSAPLTAAQVADLAAGRLYVNVHTAANPGGEIRGQVMLK